jgi:hypothetical protein
VEDNILFRYLNIYTMSYRKQFTYRLLPITNKRCSRKISKPLLRHRRKRGGSMLCKNKRRSRMQSNRITSKHPYRLNSMIKRAKKQQNRSWRNLRKVQHRNKNLYNKEEF